MWPTRRLFTLLASSLMIVVAAAVAVAATEEDDEDPSCFSLSTSEKDCLLTITSNICEWVYDDVGKSLCQEVTTTTTSTSITTLLPEDYVYTRPKRNELRYTPWNDLPRDKQVLATGSLRYTKSTWDNLGTNSIEQLRYDDLSEEQKEAAIALGFDDEVSWNCWQVRTKYR